MHDQLYKQHYSLWGDLKISLEQQHKLFGVSDTGIWRWPEFIQEMHEKGVKVVSVVRDYESCNTDLEAIGLPGEMSSSAQRAVERLPGLQIQFSELFELESAVEIWKYVTGGDDKKYPFDYQRWRALREIHMQPAFGEIAVDKAQTARLYKELMEVAKQLSE